LNDLVTAYWKCVPIEIQIKGKINMAKLTKANINLLSAIVNAFNTGAVYFVTQAEATPLLQNDPALIEVNPSMLDPNDNTKAAARPTDAGRELAAKKGKSAVTNTETPAATPAFEIITGAALPPSKRGGRGGAPTQYPFDKMEVGQSFFVPVSEKHPDPVKTLGSTVSSANHRYAEPTGEKKTVTRTKRGAGNKAMKDEAGNKIKESVTIDVLKFTRKFSIRKVEKGKAYGEWTAPNDGALIARVS
jgi:hypothetical protein